MEFKKLKKEDMPIIIISVAIIFLIMIVSAVSSLRNAEESLTFLQWAGMNIFCIWIAFIMDIVIIIDREKKRERLEMARKQEIEIEKRKQREFSVLINIKSGSIGKTGIHEIHQLFENDLFYFDNEIEELYEIVGYEWDGAKYKKITKTKSNSTDTGNAKAAGIAKGAFGMVGGIGGTKTLSNKQENGEAVESEVEERGSAIIRMKRVQDERMVSFVVECDSDMDKNIRCFNNIPM